MRFANKGVEVTGATGGIGRETSLQFAAEGAAVAVTDLDLKLAERLASEIEEKGGKAVGYELDVTDQEQTDTIVEQAANDLGSIDIIFCNAGIREIEPAHQLPLDEWRKVIDVNVTGVFVGPGHTQLTLILCLAVSLAKDFVNAIMPPLAPE